MKATLCTRDDVDCKHLPLLHEAAMHTKCLHITECPFTSAKSPQKGSNFAAEQRCVKAFCNKASCCDQLLAIAHAQLNWSYSSIRE